MTIDSVKAPELLSAEIEAIEDLLVHYEDWRALTQLELRERNGETSNNVGTSGLKAMLIEKLAGNPLFLRRQTLLKEHQRLTHSVHTPAQSITGRSSRDDDHDLTRIRGIDARLERRLNALNVRTFEQIAAFTLDDIRYVSSTLGLENRIISQMWIEQAELLAGSGGARRLQASERKSRAPIQAGHAADFDDEPLPAVPAPRFSVRRADRHSATLGDAAGDAESDAAGDADSDADSDWAGEDTREEADAVSRGPLVRAPAPAAPAMSQSARGNAAPLPVTAKSPPPPSAPAAPVESKMPGGAGAHLAKPDVAFVVASQAPAGDVAAPQVPAAAMSPRAPAPTASAPTASVPAAEPPTVAAAEPDYSALRPPAPFAASRYPRLAPDVLGPDVLAPRPEAKAVAATPVPGEQAAAAAAPPPDYSASKPASPLAASRYAGPVMETPDPGVLSGAPSPPKPRSATAYAPSQQPATTPQGQPRSDVNAPAPPPVTAPGAAPGTAPGPAAVPAAGPTPVKTAPVTPASLTAAAAMAGAAKGHEAEPGRREGINDDGRRVAEILRRDLPPLPLKPVLANPPPPLPRPVVTPQAASAPVFVQSAPSAAASAAAASAAAAAQEAAMLAAAAMRATKGSAASSAPPPPLPAGAPPRGSVHASTVHTSTIHAPMAPRPDRSEWHVAGGHAGRHDATAPEARVTIKRSDDGGSGPVIRSSGATEVHLGGEQRRQAAQFDSASYAAYHDEIEEASVQIVRRQNRPLPAAPASPSQQPAVQPAAASLAAATSFAAAAAQSRVAAVAVPFGQDKPAAEAKPSEAKSSAEAKSSDKLAAPIGRFLKALTGQ